MFLLNNLGQVHYSLCIDFLIHQTGIGGAPPEVVPVLNGSRDVSAGPQHT